MKRSRLLVLALAFAISFAFVVGVLGLHRWFGIARVAITIGLTIWIVLSDTSRREWLPSVPRKARGFLRLGVAALLAVETARVVVVIARHGFVIGDAIAILIDLIVFGYLLQGALVELGTTPGNMLFDAAVRARTTDPAKALRLATRATKLYRKWDDGWLLRASLVGEQQGQAEQVIILRKGLRTCSQSKQIQDFLISSLYATGATEEAAMLLDEYRDMFPRSGRPALLDAANAIAAGDLDAARTHLRDARERAQKERDAEALVKVARVSWMLPGDRAIGMEALEAALRADPSNTGVQITLALFVEDEQPARSRSLLDQARESWRREKHSETFDEYVAAQRTSPGALGV